MSESAWLCLLVLCTMSVSAGIELNLSRLLQYSKDGQLHGSQLAALNFYAIHFQGDVLRKVAFLHLNDANKEKIIEVLYKKPNGLVIILPHKINDPDKWQSLQEFFYTGLFPIPIYFAFENNSINEVYELLKEENQRTKDSTDSSFLYRMMSMITAEDYQVSVNINEPTLLHSLNLANYYYVLPSNNEARDEGKTTKPIIVVTASYDAFSLSPELSFGLDTNGSGMLALLELAKFFRKLFEAYGNYAKYDLIFLLTPTGSLNYKGTDVFLTELPDSFTQNLMFALSLDSIGSGNELTLHVSRLPKTNEQASNDIFNAFNITTQQMNIPFTVTKKPINQTSEYVPWEHERFAYKKIHGATLSSRSTVSTHVLDKASVYDNEFDENVLKRNIEVVSEILTKVAFGLLDNDHSIFTGDFKTLESGYIRQMAAYLKANPRTPTSLIKGSAIANELAKIFHKMMPNVTTQAFEYKDMEIAVNAPAQMKMIKSKSRMLDMFLFVVIGLYLGALYIYMTGINSFFSGKHEKLS